MLKSTGFWLVVLIAVSALTIPAPNSCSATAKQMHKQTLRRADFRIEGVSCVVCLRRIAKTLLAAKGVVKADVSVFRPYWSIVIYDANETSFKRIEASVEKEHVRFAELEEQPLSELPAVIIPKGLMHSSSETGSSSTGIQSSPASTH